LRELQDELKSMLEVEVSLSAICSASKWAHKAKNDNHCLSER
jgi:hypothetical protein